MSRTGIRLAAYLCFLLLGGLASCGGAPDGSRMPDGGPGMEQVEFIDSIRAKGYGVQVVGNVSQPFLDVQGTRLRLEEGELEEPVEIHVFEYESADAAEEDAATIGADGQPRNMHVNWVAPPHFYRKDRLIVLFVGQNDVLQKLLRDLLGKPFAAA